MNKTFSILLLVCLCNIFSSQAQDKGFVAVSGGLCLPGGDLSSTTLDFNAVGFGSSGFAKSAFSFDLSVGYKIIGNFGLAGMFRSHDHDLDLSNLKNTLNMLFGGVSGAINFDIKGTQWQCKEYMGGIYGSIPVNEKFCFDMRLMAGLLSINSAQISLIVYPSSPSSGIGGTMTQNSASTTCAAYLLGFGLRYNTNDRMCFLGNFDFLAASPHFDNVVLTATGNSNSTTSFTSNLNAITLSVGVGYSLQ